MEEQKVKQDPPRFSSFRPKTNASSLNHKNSLPVTASGPGHPVQSSNTVLSLKKRRQASHARSRKRHESDYHSLGSSTNDSQLIDSYNSRSEHFVIDTKGDIQNLRYGSPDKYKIPRYRCVGHGSVLGAPNWLRISRGHDRNGVIVLQPKDKAYVGGRKWPNAPQSSTQRELKIKSTAYLRSEDCKDEEFIPFSKFDIARPGNSHSENDAQLAVIEGQDDILAFRDLQDKSRDAEWPSDEDLEYYEPSIDKNAWTLQERTFQEKLDRQLIENPSDGKSWLDLLKLQSEVSAQAIMQGENGQGRDPISGASAAEVRMSIIENALKSIKHDEHREELILEFMNEASKLWESERVLKRWQKMLATPEPLPRLHLKFFEFMQTNLSLFHFGEIRDIASEALKAKDIPRSNWSEGAGNGFSLSCYRVLRIALCACDAGYTELGIAILQSNLEFNFRIHNVFNKEEASSFTNLQKLEEFWESEVPRIGELQYMANKEQYPSEQTSNEIPKIDGSLTLENWSQYEECVAETTQISARTTDDSDDNDPLRVVIFSDIQDYAVNAESTDEGHVLINAFLIFCELPPYQVEGIAYRWWKDPFVRNPQAYYSCQRSEEELQPTRNVFNNPVNCFRLDDSTLFAADKVWYCAFPAARQCRFGLCRRALSVLVKLGIGKEELAEYHLGLELVSDPLTTQKLAKRVLKQHPTSMRLYNAYVLIEKRCSGQEAAERILMTVLEANKNSEDSVLLWRTWVWMLIENEAYSDALHRLIMLVESSMSQLPSDLSTASRLLKAQQVTLHSVHRLLSQGDCTRASYYIEISVLLEYLSSDTTLKSSLITFATLVAQFTTDQKYAGTLELLHQFRARLIYAHFRRTSDLSAVKAREVLRESSHTFPHNTIFSSLPELLEPWARATDRVRGIVSNLRPQSLPNPEHLEEATQPLPVVLIAVENELRYLADGRSTTHAVRHVFEKAINGEGAHSVAVWRRYISFERKHGEIKRARQALYRGIRACPWAKEVYMVAFGELQTAMSATELRNMYELMEEKELRIHVPLNEVFAAL